MVTSKWLMRLTRHCSSWSIAQRQIQRTQTWVSQQTFAEYQQSLPIILDKGLADFNFSPELCDRLKKFTAYNVGSGKQIRGLLTMAACEALMQPEQKQELREKMYVLAWAAEMLHAFFLVTDDMEDGAKTRHGQTCWHLLPDVGKYAVTDTGMFRSFLSEILRVYFGKEAVYPKLVDILNETYFKTHIGQFIDSTLCSNRQYLSFTTEQYALVSAYKTSFYTFQFPVLLGLALNNKYSDKAYKIVESIGSDVGLLLQMKNDYLDLYGDEIVEGKTGTDIQEGKCSLPAVTAVKLTNEHQKNIFIENYGRWEDKCVNEIKILYNDLQLKKICVDEEKKLYNSISQRINNLPKDSIPPAHLFAKVSTICKQSDILTNLNNDFPYYLPKIIKTSLTKKKYADNIEIKERIKNLSEYHTLAREPIQGRLTFLAFDALAESKDLTEEKLHQVQVLAWAVELIQSYFLIGDDMEDSSETRCGKPTWHLLPDVGLLAINDASLLRSFIYEMIKNNFDRNTSTKMENIVNEAFFTINIGQYMDIMMSKSKDLNKFTVEQYNILNDHKSSFYTVKLPILLALELCNKVNQDSYENIEKICTDLGILLQMQNDLMDYIDRDSAAVKTSSDIQKNKCSWPAVAALQHLNVEQRREFMNCYGRWENEKVDRVREFYKEINLPHLYRLEEQKISAAVLQKIKKLPNNATPSADFFYKIFDFLRQYTEDISPSKLKSNILMSAI